MVRVGAGSDLLMDARGDGLFKRAVRRTRSGSSSRSRVSSGFEEV